MGETAARFSLGRRGRIPKGTASEQVPFGAPLVTFPAMGKSRPPAGAPPARRLSGYGNPFVFYSFACSCSSTRFLAQSQANTLDPRAQAARWAAR